jgi:hypothetical protein
MLSSGILITKAITPLLWYVVTMMVEAVSTFETSVNIYQTTRRNILEDSQFHTCRRENMKPHIRAFIETR